MNYRSVDFVCFFTYVRDILNGWFNKPKFISDIIKSILQRITNFSPVILYIPWLNIVWKVEMTKKIDIRSHRPTLNLAWSSWRSLLISEEAFMLVMSALSDFSIICCCCFNTTRVRTHSALRFDNCASAILMRPAMVGDRSRVFRRVVV